VYCTGSRGSPAGQSLGGIRLLAPHWLLPFQRLPLFLPAQPTPNPRGPTPNLCSQILIPGPAPGDSVGCFLDPLLCKFCPAPELLIRSHGCALDLRFGQDPVERVHPSCCCWGLSGGLRIHVSPAFRASKVLCHLTTTRGQSHGSDKGGRCWKSTWNRNVVLCG
jgi:hypothetical protein